MIDTEKRNFKQGDIIIFCDEEYEVINNSGRCGTVKEVYGDTIISPFYWVFGDCECILKSN